MFVYVHNGSLGRSFDDSQLNERKNKKENLISFVAPSLEMNFKQNSTESIFFVRKAENKEKKKDQGEKYLKVLSDGNLETLHLRHLSSTGNAKKAMLLVAICCSVAVVFSVAWRVVFC